jgi:hypothetical protein
VYEACEHEPAMESLQGLPEGKGLPGFYEECKSALSGDVCTDNADWAPSGIFSGSALGCFNAEDQTEGQTCDDLISMGYSCETAFCADSAVCDYAGYCDKACDFCSGTQAPCQAMFGQGAPHRCECDSFGGIHNCPDSCNGYCHAEQYSGDSGVTTVLVDRAVATGRIDDDCKRNFGRHQWFNFRAETGTVYKIYTKLVPGGLTHTELHLHNLDEDQTALVDASSWHCEPRDQSIGEVCMTWACTASGDYGIRVQQTGGTGEFSIGVSTVGTVQEVSASAGLTAPVRTPDMVLPQVRLDAGAVQAGPSAVYLERDEWGVDIGLHCDLTYCSFTKDQKRMGDGERFVMALTGVAGATYDFGLALAADSAPAYFKLTVVPADTEGGDRTFDGDEHMQKEIVLGGWPAAVADHHTYAEANKDLDLKEYRNFHTEFPREDSFAWVAPSDGDYFVVVTANCDVPLLDDVEANFGPPMTGSNCDAQCVPRYANGHFT